MEEKTSDEFGGLQCKHLPLPAIGIVFVMKADLAVFHVDETTIRDGNAVGVPPRVAVRSTDFIITKKGDGKRPRE